MKQKVKVIDNFLNESDLKELQSLNLKETKDNTLNVYVKKIENGVVSGEGISENLVKTLQKNYHDKAIEILENLFPEKTHLYEFSEFGINDTGANYNFPIHNDTPDKLLSGVIFLSPEKSDGTKFYENKKGDNENSIEWKVNRGVFFSRSENKSWHSFNNSYKNTRRVLIFNLMTKRVKDVCKVEGTNYFISKLRHKINPYFYKYFKFVI